MNGSNLGAGRAVSAAAVQNFDPSQGLRTVSTLLQSVYAGQELLVAVGAGIFLLRGRWRRAQERERERQARAAKERLDRSLIETIQIERSQAGAWEPETLRACLEQVTRVKLDALDLLAHEALQGEPLFLIFLAQCAILIEKIHLKLELGAPVRQRRRRTSRANG